MTSGTSWKFGYSKVLAQMFDRRCAGNQQYVRRPVQQPRQRHLHGSRLERRGYFIEPRRLQRGESTQGKVRHIGDALRGESIDESVIGPLGHVVEVLDADNLRDGLRLSQLLGGDGAEAEMPNQALLLEFGKRRQRLFERFVFRSGEAPQAQIDHIERIEAQISQVVMHRVDDFPA